MKPRTFSYTVGKDAAPVLVVGYTAKKGARVKVSFNGKRVQAGVLYHLPRLDSIDVVNDIRKKRENAKAKRTRTRCLGSESCDCPKCK